MDKTLAGIKVSQITTKVAHICLCDDSRPSFEGRVEGISIMWPIAFERYRLSFCPWCGLRLPNTLPGAKSKSDG